MTASEMIERDCKAAQERLKHNIGTRAGKLSARVRRDFKALRERLVKEGRL